MLIEFYTPDSGVNPEILAQVRDEIIKLHKLYKGISRANISFQQRTRQTNSEKICEINLFIAGNTITTKGVCKNFDHASKKAVAGLNESIILSLKDKIHAL